jgi:hypothetical protein
MEIQIETSTFDGYTQENCRVPRDKKSLLFFRCEIHVSRFSLLMTLIAEKVTNEKTKVDRSGPLRE